MTRPVGGRRRVRLAVIVALVLAYGAFGIWMDLRSEASGRRDYEELRVKLERVAATADPQAVADAASEASLADYRAVDDLVPDAFRRLARVEGSDLVVTYLVPDGPGTGCLRLRLSGKDRSEHDVRTC